MPTNRVQQLTEEHGYFDIRHARLVVPLRNYVSVWLISIAQIAAQTCLWVLFEHYCVAQNYWPFRLTSLGASPFSQQNRHTESSSNRNALVHLRTELRSGHNKYLFAS